MPVASRYRTSWPRLWAGLIDSAIFLPLSHVVDPWIWRAVSDPIVQALWFTFHSVAYIAYSVLCHGLWGQTVGKKLLRVRVLAANETALSMTRALLRDSPSVLLIAVSLAIDLPTVLDGQNPYDPVKIAKEGLPIMSKLLAWFSFTWFLAEFATMLLNDKRRAVHDYLAGSVVVRLPGRDANSG